MSVTPEAQQPTEGGLLNHDIWFAREDVAGVAPTDGDWNRFSDRITEAWGWQPDASVEGDRGISDVDVPEDGFYAGSEEHEAEFTYRWQKSPLDTNGAIHGACYDFLFRTADGLVPNTHTVIDREHHPAGGRDGAGFYTITVALGGRPDALENEAEVEDGTPIPVGLTYQFEKARQFVVHQPSQATGLVVTSDETADTGIEVMAESLDGSVSASATLSGTDVVALDGQFADVGAAHLSTDAVGDVTVSINTADATAPAAGTELLTIEGKRTASPTGNTGREGDLGVPPLGAGTREQEVQPAGSRSYQHFVGDRIERPDAAGVGVGPRLNSATLTSENNHDTNADASSQRMKIDRGVHDAMVEASIAGPQAEAKSTMDYLKAKGSDIVWYLDGFSLIFPSATMTDVGEYSLEAESVALYVDNTFSSAGVKLGDADGNEVALPV